MAESVFVAVPCGGGLLTYKAFPGLCQPSGRARVNLRLLDVGMIGLNFNSLWAEALNLRGGWDAPSHWAMHHADVAAPPGWLDVLLDEMARVGADVMSAVVAIKDERGLTTTAVGRDGGHVLRRLTLREVHRLPATFSADDVRRAPGETLLVNTGLWACRFTEPWVEEHCFRVHDGTRRRPDGTWEAVELTEDWAFSDWANRRGLKVWATRKVATVHQGGRGYGTAEPWGSWETDLGDAAWREALRAKT